MKLHATIRNENGKTVSKGGNEYLDIDLKVGNTLLTSLTLRFTDELPDQDGSGWCLYDENDNPISWIETQQGKKQKGNLCNCGMNAGFHEPQRNCK